VTWLYVACLLVSATTADWLTVRWHRARAGLDLAQLAVLSPVIEAINWLPIVLAIDAINPWLVAAANVVGTTIGTCGAVWRMRARADQ